VNAIPVVVYIVDDDLEVRRALARLTAFGRLQHPLVRIGWRVSG